MASRRKLTASAHFEVVHRSARRCCMCFALSADFTQKAGQIAHLDQDRTNDSVENLAWLCLPHHNEYDSNTSQSRGYTEAEVARYRDSLHAEVAAWRERQPHQESAQLFSYKQRLLNENAALFFFAALGSRHPTLRSRMLSEISDLDFRNQLVDAWTFLDSQTVEEPLPSRQEMMAQYIGSTADGKEDLNVLLGLAGSAISAMNERDRQQALFALRSDTIRSGLMLLHKIRTDRTSSDDGEV